jgi:hypothetical protein
MENNVYLAEKINFLESEVYEMKDFFQDKSSDIIKKCIRFIEKSIRHRKDIPCILCDDYDYLNTFEQICLISQEYDMDDYYGLDIYINGTVEQAYDSLSNEDKFTLNHNYFEDPIDQITKGFENYCCSYSNQKIRRALYD